ncbi:MAG: hypothetical protein E6902_01580 [Paeniclostridium sordellii]|nr:hypothetical protein [Paeniclostridium sordellii]
MLYETRMDRVNKYRDEKRIRDICEKLNKIVNKITNINPDFIYWGAKEDGYYSIGNKNKHGDSGILDLSFRLHYPDKNSFLYDKEAEGLDDEEFDRYVECRYNQSKLLYAEILWFSIEPKGNGIGTKIINELIEILKYIDSIEFIVLHPKDDDAKNFWMKNKFIEENNMMCYDRRVESWIGDKLIYIYNCG